MFLKAAQKFLIFILFANCMHKTVAQEIRVIDNKGTLKKANNNSVTSSDVAPLLPLEEDIWFDTSTEPTLIKIYNDDVWVNLSHTGTKGSVFFAASNGVPTENKLQLFWDNVNKKLGVGTDNPTNKLEVSGAIGTQGILNSNGTVGEPSFRFKNDTDTGIFRPDLVDEMGFTAGGIEAIHIEEDSNKTLVTIKDTIKLEEQLLDENNSAGTVGQVLTATNTGTKWGIAYNNVTNELIFEGTGTDSNFYYVSLNINNNWKVIKYNKTDVNIEVEATISNNAGQTTQPTTLAECQALTYN